MINIVMPARDFRIGFFGKVRQGYTLSPADFARLDSLVEQYYDRSDTLTLITPLNSGFELAIARRALDLRKRHLTRLRLEVITCNRQVADFRRHLFQGTSFSYDDIFREADEYIELESEFPTIRQREIAGYLIEHCDLLVYSTIPPGLVNYLALSVAEGALKVLTLHELQHDLIPANYYGNRLLEESLRYLRDHNFQVLSCQVPRELLDAWSSKNPERMRHYCISFQYEWADILHLRDPHGVFLPLKIFTYAYCRAHDFWMVRLENYPEDVYVKFLQFQRLVNYTRLRRLRGYSVRNMDLMDFEQYGVHIDKLFSNENQKPKSRRAGHEDY